MKVHKQADRWGRGDTVREFDSWQEWMDYCDSPLAPESDPEMTRGSQATNRNEWQGSNSWSHANELARNGWQEGREYVDAFRVELENVSSQMTVRPSIEYALSGDFVDVGRFVTGEPECFGVHTEEEVEGSGKVVRILFNGTVSAAVDTVDLMRKGAAAVALIDALECSGRRVELVLAFAVDRGSDRVEYIVPIKAPGDPVEIDRLAYVLAHPSSLRRHGFSAMEHEPKAVREAMSFSHSYSSPCNTKHVTADIEVPKMLGTDSSALLKWVMEELTKQGVTVDAP